MILTNRLGLPDSIVRAIERDEYSKGDADFSVTELIGPPRISMLARVNADKLTQDVLDRIPSLLGRALHTVVEMGASDHEIVEERFFLNIEGVRISGAADLQTPLTDGTNPDWLIRDFKLTSCYSVMMEKPEWEYQLNAYAYLANAVHGRRIVKLQIIAILKDWSRKKAQTQPDYPPTPVMVVDIPVWTVAQQEAYLRARIVLHRKARAVLDTGDPLDYCSPKERWLRDEKWAVMKPGRKGAVKLYDNADDANANLEPGQYVEHRAGTPIRCDGDYCLVSRWCKQYADERAAAGASDPSAGFP
jgi:hypothetical protein